MQNYVLNKTIYGPVQKIMYETDGIHLCCGDARFSDNIKMRHSLEKFPDFIRVPGGAKTLASPVNEAERAMILSYIHRFIIAHSAKKVIISVHADCGGYGFPKFDTPKDEKDFFCEELAKAEKVLKQYFAENKLEIVIEKQFYDFDWVYTVTHIADEELKAQKQHGKLAQMS